jgi:hypothetical protein
VINNNAQWPERCVEATAQFISSRYRLPAKTVGFTAAEGDFLETIEKEYEQATQNT